MSKAMPAWCWRTLPGPMDRAGARLSSACGLKECRRSPRRCRWLSASPSIRTQTVESRTRPPSKPAWRCTSMAASHSP